MFGLRVRKATSPAIAATGASAFHPVAAPFLALMASWALLAAIILGVRL